MKEIPAKVTGDQYTAEEFTEGLSQENQNTVINSGQLLTESNQFQQTQAIHRIGNSSTFYKLDVVNSSPNNLVVNSGSSLINNQIDTYFEGLTVDFESVDTNTGFTTLNVNGLGSIDVVFSNGDPLTAGTIFPNLFNRCIYQDNQFIYAFSNATDQVYRNQLASEVVNEEGASLIGTTGQTVQSALGELQTAFTAGGYIIDGVLDRGYGVATVIHTPGPLTQIVTTKDSNFQTILVTLAIKFSGDRSEVGGYFVSSTPTSETYEIAQWNQSGNLILTNDINFLIF